MSGDRGRILVTGASGFIGGQLIPKLVELGYDVYGVERYVTGRYVLGGFRSVKTLYADLRDFQAVRQIVREVQPERVVHLASVSAVSYSYDHPQEVIDTNLLGTVNLAEACLREVAHFSHFVFAGTSEEYGNNGANPEREDSPLRPNSPYSVSKAAADNYVSYMHSAYGFPSTVMRPFNTFGRRDNTHFVVERAVVQALKGGTIRLGDPAPMRDFIHVDDHVSGYLVALDNPSKSIGQSFNLCSGRGTSVSELVGRILSITGSEGPVVWNTIPKRPLDIATLVGDPSKAGKMLGWKPKVGLDDGLRSVVDYWKRKN